MLLLRRAQVAEQIDGDLVRLDAIERRLRTIESEGNMSEYEFVEKPLPAVRLAQLTATVPDSGAISAWMGPAYERLVAALGTAGAPPNAPAISWYDGDGETLTIAAGFPTQLSSVGVDDVEIADLAAVPRAVTVIHRGAMDTINDSWQALARQVDERGLVAFGPCREVYLQTPTDDQGRWVTELQQPVR